MRRIRTLKRESQRFQQRESGANDYHESSLSLFDYKS